MRVLSIGEFSRLTHLSIRSLRRLHAAGLLQPADVDAASSYRYYSPDQIPQAQVIQRLRELEVPVVEVRRLIGTADPGARDQLVSEHLHRLEAELDRRRAGVVSLRRLLEPEPSTLAVELRSVPAATVHAGAHDDIDVSYGRLGSWVATNMLTVAGPVRETYVVGPSDSADPGDWRTEIGWPVFRVGTS